MLHIVFSIQYILSQFGRKKTTSSFVDLCKAELEESKAIRDEKEEEQQQKEEVKFELETLVNNLNVSVVDKSLSEVLTEEKQIEANLDKDENELDNQNEPNRNIVIDMINSVFNEPDSSSNENSNINDGDGDGEKTDVNQNEETDD